MSTAHAPIREGMVVGGRYEVERLLGAGDRRIACLCRDLAGGQKRVAVKVLADGPDGASSEQFSLLRRLRHPSLVPLADFGILEDSGNLFVAHEWVQGKDLHAATEGMKTDRILALIADMAKAIQYLHTRGIIHGSLKPSNIFFSEEGGGALRMVDFGLANRAQSARPANDMLPYTAPEILLGEPANKTSDLYSLGIVFYQVLIRRLPFEDADSGFLIQKHLQGSVDFRSVERLQGGDKLSRLLRGLLDKDPAKRPASGIEVIRMIGDVLGRDCSETDIRELGNHFSASQFVGREEEMTRLKECLKRTNESGRGWTVFISGEAGSGKTRCMEELRSWALLQGCRVMEGTCRTRDEGSYGPYRQILANSEPAGGEPLFHFKGASRVPDMPQSSSEHAAGQFRDLLARELVRRLSRRPTLLLLEDFHLADEATNAVLGYLSSDIQAYPVLMCASLRSGEEAKEAVRRLMGSVVRQERGEVLSLKPLTKEDVEVLVEGMTGDSRLKGSLGSWVFKSFGGNPFFLEEALKHLVEQRILRREYGKWRFVAEDLEKVEIPASVGAVLRKRIEQLPSSVRELANWLGLFRGAVPISLLTSAMDQSADSTAKALRELDQRQMIQTGMQGTDETVEFRHPLIAEVIRGDLLPKLRRRMHRRIAEAMEREFGADGHLQELAMHHIEGQSGIPATRYALAAAAQSRAEFAHENALRCFEYIFKSRRGLNDEQLCRSAIEASDTMFALGLPKRSIRLLKAEISRCKAIGTELKARMFVQLALSYQHMGDLRMQEKYCKKGLRLFRHRPSAEVNMTKAMLWAELAFAAILQSRSRRGLIYLDKARRSCPAQNAAALNGRIHSLSASLHRIAGNLHEALSASKKAAIVLGRSRESYLACSAYSMFGHILATLGMFPQALKKHAQAVALSDKSRSVVLRSQALANLAECLCRMGRILEAGNAAELAAKSVREANNPAISYAFNSILAEIKVAAGDYQGAHRVVGRLAQDAKHNQAIYIVGHALYVSANLNFILGDFESSRSCIERLRQMRTPEAPFYEGELAEALYARILAERGSIQQALALLRLLERDVTEKRWPYQLCVVKLHACEVYLKQANLGLAERYARDALKLANSMSAASLISQSRLLLGQIYSPFRLSDHQTGFRGSVPVSGRARLSAEKAVKQLQQACRAAENSYLLDTAWKAHAELCALLKSAPGPNRSLDHAKKAYELLCKIEEQVPSDMLPLYCSAFGRSRAKAELVRLIEAARDRGSDSGVTVADIHDDEQTRILLRMSATVNSIGELSPLLESILDQLIHAMSVERALVFLRDELTGSLQLAKGRNNRQESLTGSEELDRSILTEVLRHKRPIVSANTQDDPRLPNKGLMHSAASGKLLCAPLKLSGRVLGVLYADHPLPSETMSESAISIFAAFCNLAAIAIDNALAHQHAMKDKCELERYVHQAREGYEEIVGRSASIELLRDRIGLAARSPLDILIVGESGAGKELVAQAIHRTGRRKSRKFIPVDCGSLADSLAEAELFGFRKGAFTGASENRQGLIEAADGGILFLDEISNLPFRLQAKLLRVIQEREVRRLGETAPRKVDFQLIAATNKDLLNEVKAGQFREDLYYRLKAFEIQVPPLRERAEDIPLLIERFLEDIAGPEYQRPRSFLPEALQLLKRYSYPGNVRELKNIIVGSYYSSAKETIGIDGLPPEVRCEGAVAAVSESGAAGRLYWDIMDGKGDFESLVKRPYAQHQFGSAVVRGLIEVALKDCGGNYADAFSRLRVPESRYSATLQFLKRNKCYLDFRPFRRKRL